MPKNIKIISGMIMENSTAAIPQLSAARRLKQREIRQHDATDLTMIPALIADGMRLSPSAGATGSYRRG